MTAQLSSYTASNISIVLDLLLAGFTLYYIIRLARYAGREHPDLFLNAFSWKGLILGDVGNSYEKKSLLNQRVVRRAA